MKYTVLESNLNAQLVLKSDPSLALNWTSSLITIFGKPSFLTVQSKTFPIKIRHFYSEVLEKDPLAADLARKEISMYRGCSFFGRFLSGNKSANSHFRPILVLNISKKRTQNERI